MNSLFQDIRYALRSLARSPGFTVIALITLALGIGANTSIFSVIEAVVLRPLPYRDSGRLVLLADSQDSEDGGFPYKDFDSLRSESQSLEDVAIYYRDSGFSRVTLAGAGEPQSVQGAFVTANLFSLMGLSPILGRVFTPEEATRKERVVVLSHALWMRRFGASADVVGKMLQIDGFSFHIIGGMPATFQFPARDQQFWAPITSNRYWDDPALTTSINPHPSVAILLMMIALLACYVPARRAALVEPMVALRYEIGELTERGWTAGSRHEVRFIGNRQQLSLVRH